MVVAVTMVGAVALACSPSSPPASQPAPAAPPAAPSGPNAPAPPASEGQTRFAATFETAADFEDQFDVYAGNFITDPEQAAPYTGWRTDRADELGWTEHTPMTVHGDHGMSCGGPTEQRVLDVNNPDWTQYFWHCAPGGDPAKGHVMTGFDSAFYALLGFSPSRAFNDVQRICWDINATDNGNGRWTNMQVIPESLYQQFAPRLDYVTAGFNDDVGTFNIQAKDHPGVDVWGIRDRNGQQVQTVGDTETFTSGDISDGSWMTSDKAARYTHCVENAGSGARLTVARPSGETSSYDLPVPIPSGAVRVIFQDDHYDPPKRDVYSPFNVTWHWDNIIIDTAG